MIRVALLTLACWTLLGLAAVQAKASVDPLVVANSAWPGSPCAGQLEMQFDSTLSLRGRAAEAVGVLVDAFDNYELVSCAFTVDPVYWLRASPYERCLIASHEAGHLAGHHHQATGVMREDHSDWFEPCASLRQRIVQHLAQRTGASETNVVCSARESRVIPCTVFLTRHVARFRVSVRGDVFVARRVHRRVGA